MHRFCYPTDLILYKQAQHRTICIGFVIRPIGFCTNQKQHLTICTASHIGPYASHPTWEATFPRNRHAGLGKPINENNILPSMHEASLSPCPIRRGDFSEMLLPTWLGNPAWLFLGNVVSHMDRTAPHRIAPKRPFDSTVLSATSYRQAGGQPEGR